MKSEKQIIEKLNNLLKFVLINTSHPGNIGASARAIKNMGFKGLQLVNPKDFPNKIAGFRAKAAIDVIEFTKVFKSIDEAIEDCHFVVGTSARNRKIPWPMKEPREAAEQILKRVVNNNEKVAILFGQEDRGLTNEELGRCNLHIHIPSSEDYSSLNLSQAVQIISYELRLAMINYLGISSEVDWDVSLATDQETENLIQHMNEVMLELDFYDPDNPRKILERVRRFFKRARIDVMEANIFRGIFSATQKRLK